MDCALSDRVLGVPRAMAEAYLSGELCMREVHLLIRVSAVRP